MTVGKHAELDRWRRVPPVILNSSSPQSSHTEIARLTHDQIIFSDTVLNREDLHPKYLARKKAWTVDIEESRSRMFGTHFVKWQEPRIPFGIAKSPGLLALFPEEREVLPSS